jgi:hypothetical protein
MAATQTLLLGSYSRLTVEQQCCPIEEYKTFGTQLLFADLFIALHEPMDSRGVVELVEAGRNIGHLATMLSSDCRHRAIIIVISVAPSLF